MGAVYRPQARISNKLVKLVQDIAADGKGIGALQSPVADSKQAL